MAWRVVGASVAGPGHGTEPTRNEDAWGAWSDRLGTLIVVADGLGSRPGARAGARAAVRAARKAWRLWADSPTGTPEDFVRLLEVLWRLTLRNHTPQEAATTCILVGLRPDGSWLRAQLGDGLLGWEEGGTFYVFTPVSDGFCSATLCMGAPHRLQDWHLGLSSRPPSSLLLCTDGVAVDLQEDRRQDLLRWLRDDLACTPDATEKLAAALTQWPVPNHLDDKTLVIAWKI